MSARTHEHDGSSELLTVRDLARRDTGLGVPSGEKADFVSDLAAEHMDMTVVDFSRHVVGQQVRDSYVREVIQEQNPSAFGVDIGDVEFY